MSATFMRSVSRSLNIQQEDVDEILNSYSAVGDDVLSGRPDIDGDHGLARSRRHWARSDCSSGRSGSATRSPQMTRWSADSWPRTESAAKAAAMAPVAWHRYSGDPAALG